MDSQAYQTIYMKVFLAESFPTMSRSIYDKRSSKLFTEIDAKSLLFF